MSSAHQTAKRNSGYKCIISSCLCSYRKSSSDSPVRLFAFPLDSSMFNKWVKACSLDSNSVKGTARICDRHFEAKHLGKRKLILNAIPALNLSENTLLTPFNADLWDNYEFSENKQDNEPVVKFVNAKRIKLADVNNIISNELEQQCGTETPEKVPLENHESNDIEFCENCLKREQNETYYRKKYYELMADQRKREKDLKKLNKQFLSLKRVESRRNRSFRTRTTNSKPNIISTISQMSHVSAETKMICIMLLKKTEL